MTALCAVLASGVYCLIVLGFGVRGFALAHAVGFISSALFLVPGFPLVAALLDLVQHQTTAGIARLFYGVLLTLAAAFGLSIVAALAGLATGAAGTGRSRHRADGPAVARRRLLRRRLRLRHPVQQSAAHRAGRRRPDAGGQRDPAGAARSRLRPAERHVLRRARRRPAARRWCASRCTCRASRSRCPASS